MESTSVDITTDSIRTKGFSVAKVGKQIVIKKEGASMPWLVDFDKNKLEASAKKVAKKLEREGVERIIISEIQSAMATNYDRLINNTGSASSATTTSTEAVSGPRMSGKAVKADCSMDEWRATLQEKYNDLKAMTEEKLPGLWLPLEFAISLKCILNIKDITIPFIGIVLGPPSSLKSVSVDMPKHARDTFTTDNFTPKAFVSHNSSLSEEELQQTDMLPKIKDKMFLVSELSPLFTTKDDELESIIGIITRIADGNGYWSDSGAKGHRGYDGPLMFVWLGAAVDIPYKIHKILSRLGPKLYFLRLPMSVKDENDLLRLIQQNNFRERITEVKGALFDYLEYLESCPDMQMDQVSGIPKLHWDTADPKQEQPQRYIIYLAELLAYLRGTVSTWETEGTQGLDYAYASRNIESPERAITQLHNLARGHALSQGRDFITIGGDLPLVTKVVLSGAASVERVKVLDLLLSGDKCTKYTASNIAEAIGTSIKTAKKTMAEFKALGLVDLEELGGVGEPLIQIRLKDDLDWFFEDEFKKKLKGDYAPGDFKGYLTKKNRKKKEDDNCTSSKDIEDYTRGVPKTPPTDT
jgi:DNA-binding transcriptional ArsR family regulator